MSRVNTEPAALRYVDATIGCLTQAGFSLAVADHAWNALDSYTYGFTLLQLSFPFQPDQYAGVAEEYTPQIPASQYPHLMAMSRAVIEG